MDCVTPQWKSTLPISSVCACTCVTIYNPHTIYSGMGTCQITHAGAIFSLEFTATALKLHVQLNESTPCFHVLLNSRGKIRYCLLKLLLHWHIIVSEWSEVHCFCQNCLNELSSLHFFYTGITLHYCLVNTNIMWLFHVASIFYTVMFPFTARGWKDKEKSVYLLLLIIGAC